MRILALAVVVLLSGCESPLAADQKPKVVAAKVAVAAAEVQVVKDRNELPDDLAKPQEATPADKTAADLQRVSSRTNDLGEQVDGVGLALVETEDQLRDEIRKLRDELAALRSEMEGIRDDHSKLWILMHSPPVADGANPVKEFMDAKRPEVFGFSPWFTCPHCVTHQKHWSTSKGPFDVVWGEIEDEAEAKAMGVPANAAYPLYKVPTKTGDMWLWGFTPQGLVAEFERRNK